MRYHLAAAIRAGATVLRGLTGSPSATGDTKAILTEAVPHLRLGIIQELADELAYIEECADRALAASGSEYCHGTHEAEQAWGSIQLDPVTWLRAKLKEAEQ